ncbi:MAG: DUF3127 domain-containing protein [Bacteroidales bacterium]|nr:DUF3127 domain-containing protein [Bacteroidales bacterium]
MDLYIQGKLVKVLPSQSGEGKNGPWTKQNFIIETDEKYPKKVCLVAWNERSEALNNFSEGDSLKIEIGIESREYNERWYTDVRALNLEKTSGVNQMPPPPLPNDTSASYNNPPDFPTSNIDDLPF